MTWRLGVGQLGADLGEVKANVVRCQEAQRKARDGGADLLVLPEAVLSGYMFESRDEVRAAAISADGPELDSLRETATQLSLYTVVGFVEKADSRLFNSAMLIQPGGEVTTYRKAHLPCLGLDRFVDPGDSMNPTVVETPLGHIGLAICYDIRFPEMARSLALAGADVIAQPSNYPVEAEIVATHFGIVRACENRVYLAVANRCDDERGARFMGASQIVQPTGQVAALASTTEEIIYGDVDLANARTKDIVVDPGKHEVHLFADRRPELYRAIYERSPEITHDSLARH
jgi:5-aminopentanamidase